MLSEKDYRKRFADQYRRLFFEAWRQNSLHPLEGLYWLQVMRKQKKLEHRRKEAEGKGMVVPPVMIYSITNSCNLKCKGCYAMKRMLVGRPELSLERTKQLFREAAELGVGVLMLAGGEPLLKPEILKAAGREKDIIFPVFTNGLLMDQDYLRLFQKNRNLLPVLSIEGNRKFTDDRRGSGMYTRLIRTMEMLQSSRRIFGMSITLTRENFDQVTHPVWIQAHQRMGSSLFFLVEYVPQSRTDLSLCLSEEQKDRLKGRLNLLRKQVHALFISLPGDEEPYGGCLAAGRGFIHIAADGSVEPCPFAPYSDLSLEKLNLQQALQSKFLATLRESHHLLTEAKGACTLWENRHWVEKKLETVLQD